MGELVGAQDGDARAVEKIADTDPPPVVYPWPTPSAGTVAKMDAAAIGRASVLLGGGRSRAAGGK